MVGRWVECPHCGKRFAATVDDPELLVAVPVESEGHGSSKRPGEKFCHECGAPIRAKAVICPKCGVRQPPAVYAGDEEERVPNSNRVAAGIFAILLGSLGIHKFILGFPVPAIIVLLISVLTCGWGALVTSIIGIVEGILYLSKSDAEFHQLYVVEKRQWF
jgi:TM2 domain-containing membrane protein YozV